MLNQCTLCFALLVIPLFSVAFPTTLSVNLSDTHFQIQWEAHSGEQIRFFVLERSEEEGYFQEILHLKPEFGKAPSQTFSFNDTRLVPGHRYRYRLRICLANGANQYSETVQSFFEPDQFQLNEIYALDAALGGMGLELAVWEDCEIKVSVWNLNAHQMFEQAQSLSLGQHVLNLGFPDLPAGYYYLRIESERNIIFKSFLLQ